MTLVAQCIQSVPQDMVRNFAINGWKKLFNAEPVKPTMPDRLVYPGDHPAEDAPDFEPVSRAEEIKIAGLQFDPESEQASEIQE